jgi:hypothetical protein
MLSLTRCSLMIFTALFVASPSAQTVNTAKSTPAAPVTATVPHYDLYLADLKDQRVSHVRKVNQIAGYHNQPVFSSDGRWLYFTSSQGEGNKSQMDIARFDIKTNSLDLLHRTKLSEYSPTLMPAEQALSAVVVEADGRQRLWRLPFTGEPAVLLPDVIGVGYHAWGPADDVMLFILGKDEVDHQIAYRNSTGELMTLSRNIGRGLAWRPGTNQGYFSQRIGKRLSLSKFETQNVQTTHQLVLLPELAQDFRWWSEDLLLTTAGNMIYSWKPGNKSWQHWLNLAEVCDGSLSRFSFSPDQRQIAFVCQPAEVKK